MQEFVGLRQRFDFYRFKFDRITPLLNNLCSKIGDAATVAGYNNTLAEQRLFHKPVQFCVAVCCITNNHYGRRLDFFLPALISYQPDRSFCCSLSGHSGVSNYCCGSVIFHTVFYKLFDDKIESAHSHIKDYGAGEFGEQAPVDIGVFFSFRFVAGDEDDLRTVVSIGEHNSGVLGGCDGGGYAGYYFKIDTGICENFGLISPPAEDTGVATFQPYNDFSAGGLFDEELIDFFLCEGPVGHAFGDVYNFGVRPGKLKQNRVGQLVADYTIGGF